MRGTTFAVAVLLFGVQTEAGTITQTVSYEQEGPTAIVAVYNQFNPALYGGAPLNVVFITVTVYGTGSEFQLVNTSSTNTITFNATLSGSVSSSDLYGLNGFGQFYSSTYTVPITLGPGQSTFVTPLNIPGPSGVQGTAGYTTNLSEWIGIYTAGPTLGFGNNVSVDNTMIDVIGPNPEFRRQQPCSNGDGRVSLREHGSRAFLCRDDVARPGRSRGAGVASAPCRLMPDAWPACDGTRPACRHSDDRPHSTDRPSDASGLAQAIRNLMASPKEWKGGEMNFRKVGDKWINLDLVAYVSLERPGPKPYKVHLAVMDPAGESPADPDSRLVTLEFDETDGEHLIKFLGAN